MAAMPDKSVDVVITDPPYGTTGLEWDDASNVIKALRECLRISRGAVCVFGSNPFSADVVSGLRKYWRHGWVWEKEKPANIFQAKRAPMKTHEDVMVFAESKWTYNPQMQERLLKNRRNNSVRTHKSNLYGDGKLMESVGHRSQKYPTSIQRFTSERQPVHPTQKPLALLQYLVRTYTNAGDLVLDTFVGSGTTCLAAMLEGRKSIGIEKDEQYAKIAINRIHEARGLGV
jgi:site-specific DNA-methyltransferase (adenine-specific)